MVNNSKTVLITGAAARIGKHVSYGLAQQGWHVCIHYFRSSDRAQQLADDIISLGGKASIVGGNLAVPQDLNTLVERTQAAAGSPLTALINNASTFKDDRAHNVTNAMLDYHMGVNLRAPVQLSQDFAAQLPKEQSGVIINMIDQRVLKPNPLFFSYSLSKAALYWATKTLAQSLAPNIRVNGVGPGPTLQNTGQSAEDFAGEAAHTLLGYGSSPEAILEAIVYLLNAKSVTGQMLAVDAGQHLTWQTPDLTFGGDDGP
ncbi:MAG: SDR family oxidoreductase [Litorimonas sp.]